MPSTPYVTKIARAIREAREHQYVVSGASSSAEASHAVDVIIARSALLAASEPDEAMIEAGAVYVAPVGREPNVVHKVDARAIFRAMLARALKGNDDAAIQG